MSTYDKFKLIIREEYEYKCKLFLLRAYYLLNLMRKNCLLNF